MEADIKRKVGLSYRDKKMELIPDSDCEIVHEDGKWFVIRKANGDPKTKANRYPKRYSVCFAIMGARFDRHYLYTKKEKEDNPHEVEMLNLLDDLRILLVCRDAYWKIAGDWKPDWKDLSEKYCISCFGGEVQVDTYHSLSHILSFPTAEMRDAFYENFKDLIESCKELL